ncbi:MAG: ABC transporter permease [Actinobacteria bacterium]|nr:ABC transporter permease [Actinomycetota bacterium]
MMRQAVLLVARREFIERGRSKAFLISTAFTLVLIAAIVVVPTLIGGDDATTWTLGSVGVIDGDMVSDIDALSGLDVTVVGASFDTVGAAEAALEDGDVDLVVVAGKEILTVEHTSQTLIALTTFTLESRARLDRMRELGLSESEISELNSPTYTTRTIGDVSVGPSANELIAVMGTVLLFISIITYGQWVLTGVVEEKQSRVIEVVLGAIEPRHLLAGKVLGIGGLALIQLIALLGEGFILVSAFDLVDLPATSLGAAGVIVLWFILGFALYATAYAAAGSLVDRMEDAQNAAFPLTLVLMAGYFIASFSFDTDNPILRAASLFPLFSPMAMPLRQARGDATPVEIIFAVAFMVAAIWFVIRLAGRIYTGAALRTGGKVKAREAWNSPDR